MRSLGIAWLCVATVGCNLVIGLREGKPKQGGPETTSASTGTGAGAPDACIREIQIGYTHEDGGGAPTIRAHTCALRNDGAVFCWGSNANGETDPGKINTAGIRSPSRLESIPPAATLATGGAHGCATALAGEAIRCWGAGAMGQLGTGNTPMDPSPPTELPKSAQSVRAGGQFTCAKKDGGLLCWGSDANGQIGSSQVEGAVTKPTDVARLGNDVASFATGYEHACAVRKNGDVWCWGQNDRGQLGTGSTIGEGEPVAVPNPTTPEQSLAVSAGRFHTCSIRKSTGLACWGDNSKGQLGVSVINGPNTPQYLDGKFVNNTSVSAGYAHTCVTKTVSAGGGLWCWGDNSAGQLGLGNADDTLYDAPRAVAGFAADTPAIAVAAGDRHTCAIMGAKADAKEGTVWCWGSGADGNLGQGTDMDHAIPQQVDIPCK